MIRWLWEKINIMTTRRYVPWIPKWEYGSYQSFVFCQQNKSVCCCNRIYASEIFSLLLPSKLSSTAMMQKRFTKASGVPEYCAASDETLYSLPSKKMKKINKNDLPSGIVLFMNYFSKHGLDDFPAKLLITGNVLEVNNNP